MATADKVKKLTSSLGLLGTDGALKQLDSMALIDLIVALESSFSIAIPAGEVQQEQFQSVATIAQFVDKLLAPAAASGT